MKIAIVGLGLIGGSLALDLKRSGFAQEVIGVDHSEEHCRKAIELHLVDQIEEFDSAVRTADLVILAIPVNAIAEVLPIVMDLVRETTTVTDMGSTKKLICEKVANHTKRQQFVPSHPMAGTENSGPTAALEGLFFGKTAIICDPDQSSSYHLNRVKELYSALQARLIYMPSMSHDLHVAYVSHLSHISSFALANTVLAKEKSTSTIFDLAGGGFESTVRLAKSSPAMWSPIFEQNRTHVIDALESYIEHLSEFRKNLVSGQIEETQALMTNANQIRRVLQSIVKKEEPNEG